MKIEVEEDELEVEPNKKDMEKIGIYKIDSLLLNSDGQMRFKDQHVDILSRYIYPLSYVTVYSIFKAKWDQKYS